MDEVRLAPKPPSGSQPENFPLDLAVGGESVTATSVEPLAWDRFTRTETDTWGTSGSGHDWREVQGDPTDRSVDGTSGLIVLQSSPSEIRFQEVLELASTADCEFLLSVTPDQLATGASYLPGVFFRGDRWEYYRCRTVLGTDGSVGLQAVQVTTVIGSAVTTPYSYSGGTKLWLRARMDGLRVRGRVWPDSAGSPEPAAWQIDQAMPTGPNPNGSVGLTCSAFAGNTNTNPQFAYDDFEITTPQRFTVTRSVNGVTKDHLKGAGVALAQPAHVAF
ncbi:hypothetical protein [Streptomyces boncukensis]|uniref:Uncharacterized protein n=1 Tax=Streptomyces boncukensis TaxID=2711219 RepID=A0A6G4WWA8_9ACTN|nr:hypothetical protein [Streptomyces boncukensis]NGO69293.1 hypothetical protein [Streptomyces boncukensis]